MSPRSRTSWIVALFLVCIVAAPATAYGDRAPRDIVRIFKLIFAKLERALDFDAYEWIEVNPSAPWAPRAGLESVELNGRFYVLGGRTPLPPPAPPFASIIQRDVWVSDHKGLTWEFLGEAPWPERAFFEAVVKDGHIYVMGGQSFDLVCFSPNGCPPDPPVPVSRFYNDVWRSPDGINWELLTEDAGWEGRAGLSAVVYKHRIWVFAGAQGDDEAIGGSGREFYRDVWNSKHGRHWRKVTDEAPWPGRGGAAAVVKNRSIYMIGGENGFLLPPLADVWRTRNGRHWQLVNKEAWLPRSGHKCGVLLNNIFCFGGFNLIGNPMDVQRSPDGIHWTALESPAAPPWNAESPEGIKYDYDLIVSKRKRGPGGTIYTFGGDRETFEPPPPIGGPFGSPGEQPSEGPPEAFDGPPLPPDLRVDNDVWRFAPPSD